MKVICTLIVALVSLPVFCQDLTGIWRGSFVSADNKMTDLFNLEDRYKYEVQIDQRGNAFNGVTYSYKTTVFYGKASSNGTVNAKTGKVVLQELKLLELKMAESSYACWMICFLQYTKNGDEEFLEGKYSSYRESDSSACGRGNVFLRKVVTSDFYKEPFLAKREKEKKDALTKTSKIPDSTGLAKKAAPANTSKKPTTDAGIAKNKTVPPNMKHVAPPVASAKKIPTPVQHDLVKNTPHKSAAGSSVNPPSTTNKTADVDRLVQGSESDKKLPAVKIKDPVLLPPVLKNRENQVVQSISVASNEVTINIYDNGTIDHDTISVYLDKKLVINHQMLTTNAITLKLKMDDNNDYHELVMVADNLGDIPPNTSLMVVKAGDKQYEVRIASTEQKNAVVIFKYEKTK